MVVGTDSHEIQCYLLIVEAKRESISEAMGGCLLVMKNMWNSNKGGVVYGLATTGVAGRL